jgi:hypothetical protein
MKRTPASTSAFINLGLLRLIIPIALFWGGGQGLYTALKNRAPHSITFAEYVHTKPDREWVELKDTRLDFLSAITKSIGTPTDAYIPLHAPDEPDDAKVPALLHTKDAAMLDLVKQIKALPDEKATIEFMVKNRERIFPRQTVSGLVEFGVDSNSKKRRKIAKLNANLAENFAIINHNDKPDLMLGIILVGVALPVTWLCWFRSWGSSKTPPPVPTASPGAPPPMPPASAGGPPPTIIK